MGYCLARNGVTVVENCVHIFFRGGSRILSAPTAATLCRGATGSDVVCLWVMCVGLRDQEGVLSGNLGIHL